jgi:hypothetical protein
VEWKAPTGEAFPTEDDKEQVVFASFFEHGFNVPAGDCFRGLLYYYKLELVHLVPNSITVVSSFIHLYEAYLRIPPHFLLWIDMNLPDNTSGWRSEWFYITDQKLTLLKRTGHMPEKITEWDMPLSSREMEDLKELLTLLADLKKKGLAGGSVAMSFCPLLI